MQFFGSNLYEIIGFERKNNSPDSEMESGLSYSALK